MADQLLTVEVEAKLDSLSTGLGKATKDIQNFVNTSIPGLDNLQKVLNSLGVNTASQSMEEIKRSTQGARTETELARKGLIEARTEQVKFRTELMQGKVAIEAAAGSYDETRQQLTALGKEIRAAGGAMDGSNPHIAGMVEKYNLLNSKLKAVDGTMGNFQRNVGNYSMKSGQALTDFGRIAQDLPFGFMAIQNNLNPMLESFGRLKEETGSTGSALKSMAQGLVGPAGIGVALAVVSAGILLYQKYMASSKKATEDAKKATVEYAETLGQIEQAHLKGGIASLKERTELDTLYKASQNATLSTEQRTKAVEALQDKYPAYFADLDQETIKNGGASDAYDRLTTSIIATARARAAQDLITKNSTRSLENEQKLADAEIAYGKAKLDQQTALNKMKAPGQGGGSQFYAHEAENAEKEQAKLAKVITDLKTDDNILNQKNLKLTESINEQIQKGADIANIKGNSTDGTAGEKASLMMAEAQASSSIMADLSNELLKAENQFDGTFGSIQKDKVQAYQKAIEKLIDEGVDPASASILKLKQAQADLFKGDLGGVGTPGGVKSNRLPETIIQPNLTLAPVITGDTEFEKKIARFQAVASEAKDRVNETLQNFVDSGIAAGISDAFIGVGSAIASGANILSAAGDALKHAFGALMAELGKQFTTMGIAKMAAGALMSPFGWGEVAKGAALVALGASLSMGGGIVNSSGSGSSNRGSNGSRNASANYGVPHFASGGIVSGPTLAMVGEYPGAKHDPEIISPLSKLKGMIGTNNSGSTQVMIPEVRLSGQDLVMAFKRAERNNSRG